MPLPHCPAKYGSRAIITARQAIEAGRQTGRHGTLPPARRVGQTPQQSWHLHPT